MADVPVYDWAGITGKTVERLKKAKVKPCPPEIVALAQLSYDEGRVKSHEFATKEMAAKFAEFITQAAGFHTTPETTTQAVIDPEEDGNLRLVNWKTSQRRGRNRAAVVEAEVAAAVPPAE